MTVSERAFLDMYLPLRSKEFDAELQLLLEQREKRGYDQGYEDGYDEGTRDCEEEFLP